jgi:hypothetical protein
MSVKTRPQIKVADEVWVATALLHQENPCKEDFAIKEIQARAEQEGIIDERRPGIYPHVLQHCVANLPPSPNRYRMLLETKPGYRRLFRTGDNYDPQRRGKVTPRESDIPLRYVGLLKWYEKWSNSNVEKGIQSDPLLALYGSGKSLWSDEHADDYVARLREGWE